MRFQRVPQRTRQCISILVLVSATGSCGSDAGYPALMVTVVDTQTGGPPLTEVLMVVTDGAFSETYRVAPPRTLPLVAASQRPGTYSIELSAAGYRTWRISAARVGDSFLCDRIDTRRLTAELERDGSI